MATVEGKLKLFARVVFEKVQKDSDEKVIRFTTEYDKYLTEEKEKILKESQAMVEQARKKAEAKKYEIIAKANTGAQHELLKKRKEIFDQVVDDLRNMAENYTSRPEYAGYLEKCIRDGLSRLNTKDVVIYLKPRDISNFGNKINEIINKYKAADTVVSVKETSSDILGGCVLENGEGTMRVDSTMASVLEENRGLIGRELLDNLQ